VLRVIYDEDTRHQSAAYVVHARAASKTA
jgi:hypothetical protein